MFTAGSVRSDVRERRMPREPHGAGGCRLSAPARRRATRRALASGLVVLCTVLPAAPAVAAPALSKVTVNPTDVVGGDPATGTVTLTAPAAAGGFAVALSSDNMTAATVPPSVTVAAGATSANFPVTTNKVSNSQSADIIGTAGGVTAYAIITAWTPFAYANGSIAIVPGNNGSGRVTSQPAGIDCTITRGNGSGACSAFFPVGTIVRLEARAAADSSFVGWRGLPGCADPSRVKVARGTTIYCQPGFSLR